MSKEEKKTIDPATINQIILLAKQFKAFGDLADNLTDASQIRQLTTNETAKLHEVRAAHEATKAELDSADKRLADMVEAEKEMKARHAQMDKDAADRLDQSATLAAKVMSDAQERANALMRATDATIEEKSKELDDMRNEVARVKDLLKAGQQQFVKLTQDHDVLKRKHEALSAKLRAMQSDL